MKQLPVTSPQILKVENVPNSRVLQKPTFGAICNLIEDSEMSNELTEANKTSFHSLRNIRSDIYLEL